MMEAHRRFKGEEGIEEKGMKEPLVHHVASTEAKKLSSKPHFRPAKDDTKPLLQDPISRSDPVEAEEAVIVLPPFPVINSSHRLNIHLS